MTTTDSIKAQFQSSMAHKFIEASISIAEDAVISDTINLKSNSKIEARSPLGLSVMAEHTGMAGINQEEISADNKFEGEFKAGPIYGKTISTQSLAIFPYRPEAKIDSNFQVDSTIVRVQNAITATFLNGQVSVVSKTSAFEDIFTHNAELSFRDRKVSLIGTTTALALGMKLHNQMEASAAAGEVLLRMETNTDHSDNRVYSLVTASLDVNGLKVNSNANVKLLENEATHNVSLIMDKDGLAASGTTTLQSLLSMENTFTAVVDATQGRISITNKAAMYDIKVDNTNNIVITPYGLNVESKTEASAHEYGSYNHVISIDMVPYRVHAGVSNKLNILGASFFNDVNLRAEVFKAHLMVEQQASYGEEFFRYVYYVGFDETTAMTQCRITVQSLGTHMKHSTDIEVTGLAATITSETLLNSESLRINHAVRGNIIPYDFNLNAILNAEGNMTLYGSHSAQIYNKFQFRAQPMVLASSNECRASGTQQLNNGFSLETTFDNKMITSLSLEEQMTSFKLKSKINEHAFDQNLEVYNTPETTGVEVSGTILTNIINTASTENQEFTASGLLKYNKKTDSHIIEIENLFFVLEEFKGFAVYVAQALHDYINNEHIQAQIKALPDHVRNLAIEINIEGRVIQLTEYLSNVITKYNLSMDDMETFLRNLKVTIEELLSSLFVHIQRFVETMTKTISSVNFPEVTIQKIQEWLNDLNEEYDIKPVVVYVTDTIREIIQEFDLETLKGSSFAFLRDIDAKYDIKSKLQSILQEIKRIIEAFDLKEIAANLNKLISSIDLKAHIEELVRHIPTEIPREITDCIRKIIQDLDVINKINTLNGKIRELIAKLEVDKKAQAVLEAAAELIKKLNMKKVIDNIVINLHRMIDGLMFISQHFIDMFKVHEVKFIIEEINRLIEMNVNELNSLEYNDFMRTADDMIQISVHIMNSIMMEYEIPQKLQAMRDFGNVVLSFVRGLSESLREIKIAELFKFLKHIFDDIVVDTLKRVAQLVKEKITSLDIKGEIRSYLNFVVKYYKRVLNIMNGMAITILDIIKKIVPDDRIISEIQRIINELFTELKKAEINIPSFTVPLTDLVLPSMEFSVDKLSQFQIPTQIHIPEFTILGLHTVKATTISIDEIKQIIIELIDLIVNFEMNMFDMDAFFGQYSMNFLPPMPEITLPEINLSELSFSNIPRIDEGKLVKFLQVPKISLPTIPTAIRVPSFGTLLGELKLQTPIITIMTSAQFQNATENAMTPQFKGVFLSHGTSPSFDILNYKLESTARIAIPKMRRVVFGETVKFSHLALGADHQATITLYGLSAQAQAKTDIKVTTAPYTANFVNIAFIAMERGMTATLDTTYTHLVDIPAGYVRSEVTLKQKSLVRQDGYGLTLTTDNTGVFNGDDTHSSKLELSLTPSNITLSFIGDTDTSMLKIKQSVTAEIGTFYYLKFNVRNEAEGPIIKSSLLVASGSANLHDLKVELKANQDTELYGAVTGRFSNAINIIALPDEFFFEFQNKGNAKVNIFESVTAKIELQNDYLANINPDSQKMNTVILTRLNQYKMFCNFTVDNNVHEAGIFAAMESEASLDFLRYPISIPEIDLPFVDFHTPVINDLNLYEQFGLEHILITTDQTFDVDTKIVYQKSKDAPLVDIMDLIQIPSLGNLVTELSVKSAIINLIANARMQTEDDLVFRLEATTTSVFEDLGAKLVGTTSISTNWGLKMANSLSFENPRIGGTHHSTISVNTDTFESELSVASTANVALPLLNLQANQKLEVGIKNEANAISKLTVRGNFNIPMIKAVAKADAHHSLKLEGTSEYISMESSNRASMNGSVYEDYLAFGLLDNEATVFLNKDALRSTAHFIADAKLNHGATKVIGMGVNENLSIEASTSRVYAVLKYTGNNEANLFNFNTNGRHIAQAKVDCVPSSSLTAEIDIKLSQPTNLGDFSVFQKTSAEVAAAKQSIFTNTTLVSPLYYTIMTAGVGRGIINNSPAIQAIVRSASSSAFVVLEHDLYGELMKIPHKHLSVLDFKHS